MKITTRLTFQFSAFVAALLALLLVFVYYLTVLSVRNEFFQRLEDRAYIAAQIFLEKDELSQNYFDEFEQKYLQKLGKEIIQLFDDENEPAFLEESDRISLTQKDLELIRQRGKANFMHGDYQTVGIYYYDNQGNFIILASAVDRYGMKQLENMLQIMVISYLIALLALWFVGQIFVKKALSPVRNIIRQVKNINTGNFTLRVAEGKSKDEITELAQSFNQMIKRVEKSISIQKSFITNASHELRTPLTVMIGQVEVVLLKERDVEKYQETLKKVLREAKQMKHLTNSLLYLANDKLEERNQNAEHRELIRLDEMLWELKEEVEADRGGTIALELVDPPEDQDQLSILGVESLMKASIGNILDNGLKFSDLKTVHCHLLFEKDHLRIKIKDQGIGIKEEDMNKIFEPFYRTEEARSYEGHGIGLPLARKIIEMQGGTIKVESEFGKGTSFTISFPVGS